MQPAGPSPASRPRAICVAWPSGRQSCHEPSPALTVRRF
jgi:hypothetical protein